MAGPGWRSVNEFLSDVLTGKDNLTYDAARVVGVIGAYAAFRAVQVRRSASFSPADARAYAEGLGLVAMAGAVKLKASEEPQPA